MATETITIPKRFSWLTALSIEIECDPALPPRVKLGLAVGVAYKSDADLRGAVLRGADLRGAPKIENIHQVVYAAASQPGALNMETWHTCETTHCRAGWVVALAGDAGRALQSLSGTGNAAALIYMASDAGLERIPNWVASDSDALADMKRLADAEAAA